jgi:hypothetical protein
MRSKVTTMSDDDQPVIANPLSAIRGGPRRISYLTQVLARFEP